MDTFSKNQVNFYTVTEKDHNQRLDNLLNKILKNTPKSLIFKIIRTGEVKINNKKASFSTKVILNDVIRIPPIVIDTLHVNTQPIATKNIKFDILFEDDYYIIINKPSGIACHGGSGISYGIIEQMRAVYTALPFLELVHRIDKNTSGILIIAKKRLALIKLQEIIKNGDMKKIYLALTIGRFEHKSHNVCVPLYKYMSPNNERRVRVDSELGSYAHTIFNVVTWYDNFTLVKANIKTGRTHQIRVHLQHLKYPIAMDDKYGNFEINDNLPKMGLKRMFLHAHFVEFVHPMTNKKITITSELPNDLKKFLEKLS